MYCPSCGEEIDDDSVSCPHCGTNTPPSLRDDGESETGQTGAVESGGRESEAGGVSSGTDRPIRDYQFSPRMVAVWAAFIFAVFGQFAFLAVSGDDATAAERVPIALVVFGLPALISLVVVWLEHRDRHRMKTLQERATPVQGTVTSAERRKTYHTISLRHRAPYYIPEITVQYEGDGYEGTTSTLYPKDLTLKHPVEHANRLLDRYEVGESVEVYVDPEFRCEPYLEPPPKYKGRWEPTIIALLWLLFIIVCTPIMVFLPG